MSSFELCLCNMPHKNLANPMLGTGPEHASAKVDHECMLKL